MSDAVASEGAAGLPARMAVMGEALGGALCLDLANSVEPRGGGALADLSAAPDLRDDLNEVPDLLAWAVKHGVHDTAAATRLWPTLSGPDAADAFGRVLAFRDVIYRLFCAVAGGAAPRQDDLAALQATYAEAMRTATLAVTPAGPGHSWPDADLRLVLWRAAVSALEVLRDVPPAKIKICPGPGRAGIPCGWLFIDSTKNRSRRWCSMAECGSVTKSRRQNARRQAGRAVGGRA